jgi:hypothetical protein
MNRLTIATLVCLVMAPGAGPASAGDECRLVGHPCWCTSTQLKAVGKDEKSLLTCQSKVATKGTAAVEPACDQKAMDKFDAQYNKSSACTGPSAAMCDANAKDCRDKLRAALPDGDETNPSKCEAARLKAAGKKASAKLKCYAKAALKSLPVDTAPGGCLDKATNKFTASFNKVSGCTGDGQLNAIEALIDDECVNQQVTVDGMNHVTGICPTPAVTTTTTSSTTTTSTSSTTTTTAPTCGGTQMCHDVCTVGPAECTTCTAADGAGTSGTPGVTCVQAVCAEDPTCCDTTGTFTWSSLCVSEVDSFCCPSGGTCCGS